MTPIVPHLSEELWNKNKNSFVSNEAYPKFNLKEIYEKEEVGEYLLLGVTEDIAEILKVTKIKPKKICIYTSPKWKYTLFQKAIVISSKGKLNTGLIMKEVMSDPKMKSIAKEVSQFVGKLAVRGFYLLRYT